MKRPRRKPRRKARGGTQSTVVKGRRGEWLGHQPRRPDDPEPQADPQRNGKPLALAGRPGRRRKTKTISSSGGAIAQPARRRRRGRGHDRPGSSGMKPVAGSATQLRVAGRSWRGAASEGLMPGAQGELQRNGKLFVLPIKAVRGRKTKTISSSGGAIAQPARRRRSGRGHDRSGSLRHEAGGGVSYAVKGGGAQLAGHRQRSSGARSPSRTRT